MQQLGGDSAEMYVAASNILPSLLNDGEEEYNDESNLDDELDESETGSLTGRIVVIPGDSVDHQNSHHYESKGPSFELLSKLSTLAVVKSFKAK